MAECASGSERADVMTARWVKVTRSKNYVHGCEWGPWARGSGVDVRTVGEGQGSVRRGGDADDHEGVKVIARRRGGEPYREKKGTPFGRVSGLRGLEKALAFTAPTGLHLAEASRNELSRGIKRRPPNEAGTRT